MKASRKAAVAAASVVVVAVGTGVAVAQRDTACERYQAVATEVERAEDQGRSDITFEESQRRQAEALAECMEEQAESGQ